MANKQSIDIVIPSFRLNETVLLRIINLPKPTGFQVYIYIVVDNPTARVPDSLYELSRTGTVTLLINQANRGVSETRNRGIRAGNSQWILLLDDDVCPQENLLLAYASVSQQYTDAIGFVGVTCFPKPINAVTTALVINGSVAHFSAAREHDFLIWAPTANLMLNRQKMDARLFDPTLTKSGEDIDFLVRNSRQFNEKYRSVPEAVVVHPWWNNGGLQTRRLIRYGEGASEIAEREPIRHYTYRDFTNTSETILLLIVLFPIAFIGGCSSVVVAVLIALLSAEFMTNWIKAIFIGKTWSISVAFHLLWAKNCYEFGYLRHSLCRGRITGFAERIDLGFTKPHPSPFRLNKWKILKSIILLVLLTLLIKLV